MEMSAVDRRIVWVRALLPALLLLLFAAAAFAQGQPENSYAIRDGRMYVTVMKHVDKMKLDSFVNQYDLADLRLAQAMDSKDFSRLRAKGWKVETNNNRVLTISKKILGPENLGDPAKKIAMAEIGVNMSTGIPIKVELFPARSENLLYGYNRFIHKFPFATADSVVTFFMKGHTSARETLLAGSFTNWQQAALRMIKTDSGWILPVKLGPGKYWYKFIVDGRWYVDGDNTLRENDGQGNINSVYYQPNVTFTLDHYMNAREVYLTGSFNHWRPDELPMVKTTAGWIIKLYLPEGTHSYMYLVDGVAYTDPGNPYTLPDGHLGLHSVLSIGQTHLFRLDGYGAARQVFLAGSFNNWNAGELEMKKKGNAWELPYVLGPGNYAYKFIVDGKWIVDPGNPYFVSEMGNKAPGNSYVVIDPNHTFMLHGHASAKNVFLAGDFNNWTPGSLRMTRVGDAWQFSVHLSVGKHLYKFIVDGEWIRDPGNELWEENEYHTGNSVIWVEH